MAEQVAIGADRRRVLLTLGQVGLPVVAVTLGVVAGLATHWEWLGFATSGAVAIVALLCLIQRSTGVDATWHQARAVAEAVKSLAWRFVMRSAPFDNADETEADRQFIAALRDVLERHPTVLASTERPQITDAMRSLRQAPPEVRLGVYRQDRVSDQLDWYVERERRARLARNRCDIAFYSLATAAIVSGFALVSVSFFAPVVAAAGTAAGAALTWGAFRRYASLMQIYERTARELSFLQSLEPDPQDAPGVHHYVDLVEAEVGREHGQWLAAHS